MGREVGRFKIWSDAKSLGHQPIRLRLLGSRMEY